MSKKLAIALTTKDLKTLEREIVELETRQFEEFIEIGKRLSLIYGGKYRDGGYKSFSDYCNRGPLCYSRAHASRLVAAAAVRHKLPDLVPIGTTWSECSIRPLTLIKRPDGSIDAVQAGRLAREAVREVKAGRARFGPKLIGSIVSEFLASTAKARSARKQKLELSDKPHEILANWLIDVELWQASAERWPAEAWQDAEEADPGCAERFAAGLEALASFIRS